MGSHGHHPTPKGATAGEQRVVERMHRAAETALYADLRPVLSEGLRLILDLIEARNRRRDFEERCDATHDGG